MAKNLLLMARRTEKTGRWLLEREIQINVATRYDRQGCRQIVEDPTSSRAPENWKEKELLIKRILFSRKFTMRSRSKFSRREDS